MVHAIDYIPRANYHDSNISVELLFDDKLHEVFDEKPHHQVSSDDSLEISLHDCDTELLQWLNELVDSRGNYFNDTKAVKNKLSSYNIFMKFVHRQADGTVDCYPLISRKCYEMWRQHHGHGKCRPMESFRKILISHVTKSDSRCMCFPANIEAAILKMLRGGNRVWPCFENRFDSVTGKPVNIGIKGVRCHGYHETLAKKIITESEFKRSREDFSELDNSSNKQQRTNDV